ncbi:MAG: hypothetical protein ACFNQA_01175 [Flavobacteriaceae bacterium]
MYYKNIREEELKNKVGEDWFKNFDTTEIIGNIDFSVFPSQGDLFGRIPLLWAEAKTGNYDTTTMFVQLILTIGKARTFDKTLPPAFLGAFDFQKIAFVPYISIQDIFYLNDFNWNVTPSNHETKEFQLIKERIEKTLKQNAHIYDYEKDAKELKFFIERNIANSTHTAKIKIDKNNFIPIYLRWLDVVKPSIEVNWDDLKKVGILDSDFYLADLFVDDKNTQNIEDDQSIRDSLFVIYQNQGYKIAKENLNQMFDATISIRNKEVYQQFWKRYKRPPLKEYQEYIIERRDLLVPQDIRERKGAFFTPRQWVELSQKYLTDYLGENWQDEYYIWDCAAGTGNLLAGLTNKYNIYASTLDQADVNVMHERIEHGANLLKNHVFQFDFLNDEFIPQKEGGKMPDSLYEIISDEEKQKKLVIYINPPYAEGDNVRGIGRKNVHVSRIHSKYQDIIGKASSEMFAQFFTRIYNEIPNCKLGEFSTLKILQAPNFSDFRNFYRAKLEKIFVVPANTFDNVSGEFPIGFFIWDTNKKEIFKETIADVYDKKGRFIGIKLLPSYDGEKYISDWLNEKSKNISPNYIGHLASVGNDFQNQRMVFLDNEEKENWKKGGRHTRISEENLIPMCIYLSVRHCIPADWLNDRDQFLYPNDGWQTDTEFQSDCLAYTLFHGQNRISSKEGINHWIPFTEQEVDAPERFASNFMTDFIKGKIKPTEEEEHQKIFNQDNLNLIPSAPLVFSSEAQAVFDAGKELWRYYMKQENINPNASLYDIREHFQGRNDKGKMNNNSSDETYTQLIGKLREALKVLAEKITPKVFEYGFLRK